jgi:hypothetical protein
MQMYIHKRNVSDRKQATVLFETKHTHNLTSVTRLVGTGVRLGAGLSGIRIPARAEDFSLLQMVQTGCVSHPPSYSKCSWVLSRGEGDRGVKITTHI